MSTIEIIMVFVGAFGLVLVFSFIADAIKQPSIKRDEQEYKEQKKRSANLKIQMEKVEYTVQYLDKCDDYILKRKLTGGKNGLEIDFLSTFNRIKEHERRTKENAEKVRLEKITKEKQRINASNAGKLIELSIEPIYNNNNTQPGVYIIVNNKTLDFYIGESQNMNFRRKTHLGELVDECHHSKLMQEHFNRYGKNVFDFYVIERQGMHEENVRRYAEERWIKEYKPTYNTSF